MFEHPVVLAIAGSDPSGGAGIAADIETLAALGCHTAPVISAIAVQDTLGVRRVVALDPELVAEQAAAALEDLPIAAIKIGLAGSAGTIERIAALLHSHAAIPVVLDPVLRSGSGTPLLEQEDIAALRRHLLPRTTILTPNLHEVRQLAGEAQEAQTCAQMLFAYGCRAVLITAADEPTPEVRNILYLPDGSSTTYIWRRLPQVYHGSGCTLAAALAGRLAQGEPLAAAVQQAQAYTWQALQHGRQLGRGQWHPARIQAPWKP